MTGISIWVWFAIVAALTTAVALLARRLQRTRERLGRMESRLTAVLEAPAAGLAVWGGDRRLLACNDRFREFYPSAPIKPGLMFEDLTRYTANRGLIQIPGDDIETWVTERVDRFGTAQHDVLHTPDGRWLDIRTQPVDTGELLMLYTDTTQVRETEATLSDRSQRLEQQSSDLGLLADAIAVANVASSFDEAAGRLVELVCRWAGWPVGYAYHVAADGTLDPVPAWYCEEAAASSLAPLLTLVERGRPSKGDGLAGRALQTGRLVWVPSVSVDPAIDPEQRDAMVGIRGACAVPVLRDDRVVAVLEFLSRDQLVPDPVTTQVLEAVAATVAWALTSPSVE